MIRFRFVFLLGVTLLAGAACSGRTRLHPAMLSPVERARADSARLPYVQADIDFMSGMIPHHAQAVRIARWVPTHGARDDVKILAERIIVAQRDEIQLMQMWLRDRNQPVPDSNATHMRMNMGGMVHDMLMPGMLSDAELAQLDSARGKEFHRLFLTFMIKHHEGALTMVDTLFKSYGAAQDETVFRFASDVYADQTTEIDRMYRMLSEIPPGPASQESAAVAPRHTPRNGSFR